MKVIISMSVPLCDHGSRYSCCWRQLVIKYFSSLCRGTPNFISHTPLKPNFVDRTASNLEYVNLPGSNYGSLVIMVKVLGWCMNSYHIFCSSTREKKNTEFCQQQQNNSWDKEKLN